MPNQALHTEPRSRAVWQWRIVRRGPVNMVDYEVLGLASDGRHCLMIFFGPTFFLVRVLGADCGDDRCSLT